MSYLDVLAELGWQPIAAIHSRQWRRRPSEKASPGLRLCTLGSGGAGKGGDTFGALVTLSLPAAHSVHRARGRDRAPSSQEDDCP